MGVTSVEVVAAGVSPYDLQRAASAHDDHNERRRIDSAMLTFAATEG